MPDRREQIVMLLGSRFDDLWLPTGSLRTSPGLAPGDRTPCATCGGVELRDDFGKVIRRRKGAGRIRDRFSRGDRVRWQRCPTCLGDGWVARDRMDATRARLGSEETGASSRPRRTVTCDRCAGDGVWKGALCELCGGTGKRELHVFELHLDLGEHAGDRDPIAEAVDRRDRRGSYAELERALNGLVHHVNKPARFGGLRGKTARQARRWIDQLYLPPAEFVLADLSPFGQQVVGAALAYVDWRMPDPIRVPADVRVNHREQARHRRRVHGRASDPAALEQRDREIRRLIRQGTPTAWVAREFGLTVSQVNRIVAGAGEATG